MISNSKKKLIIEFYFTGLTYKIAPKVRLDDKITVEEGSSVSHVPCFAEGIPTPKIVWESIDVCIYFYKKKSI